MKCVKMVVTAVELCVSLAVTCDTLQATHSRESLSVTTSPTLSSPVTGHRNKLVIVKKTDRVRLIIVCHQAKHCKYTI